MLRKRPVLLGIIMTVLTVFPTPSASATTTDDENDVTDGSSDGSVYDAYSNVPYWINLAAELDVTFFATDPGDVLLRAGVGPKFLVHTKSKATSVSFTTLLHYSRTEHAYPGSYYFDYYPGRNQFDTPGTYQGRDKAADGIGATLLLSVEFNLSRVRWGIFAGVGLDYFLPPESHDPATVLNTFLGVEFWPPPLTPGFQMGLSLGCVIAQIPLIEGTSNFKDISFVWPRLSLTFLFDIHMMNENSIHDFEDKEVR